MLDFSSRLCSQSGLEVKRSWGSQLSLQQLALARGDDFGSQSMEIGCENWPERLWGISEDF